MSSLKIVYMYDTAADLMTVMEGQFLSLDHKKCHKIGFEIRKAALEIENLRRDLSIARAELSLAQTHIDKARAATAAE
ncbi:MAG: hypothetical protein ACO3M2_11920 [Pseudohongiellaceae bacterium]